MRRRPTSLERQSRKTASLPCAHSALCFMIRNHLEVAIGYICCRETARNFAQGKRIMKSIVGIQEANGIAVVQPKSLVHRIVNSAVRLRDDAYERRTVG